MVPVVPVPAEAVAPARFSVHFLSSGSAGNSTLVCDGESWFLVDFGLPPDRFIELARARDVRLAYWREHRPGKAARHQPPVPGTHRIAAAVATHLHGDHVHPRTLRLLNDNGVRLWVHSLHAGELSGCREFRDLRAAGLVSLYGAEPFAVTPNTTAHPAEVPHDATATHGFVFHRPVPGHHGVKFSYFADLGHFRKELAGMASDSDILALEFNHDPGMERACRRPQRTIDRVLGNYGHLSNHQAAAALEHIIEKSRRKPQWVAALHVSSDCNRPELAHAAAAGVLERHSPGTRVILTRQRQYAGCAEVDLVPAPPPAAPPANPPAKARPPARREKEYIQLELF